MTPALQAEGRRLVRAVRAAVGHDEISSTRAAAEAWFWAHTVELLGPFSWVYQDYAPGNPNRDARGRCLHCLENRGCSLKKCEEGHRGSIERGLGKAVPYEEDQ
jgi:hypothetical protein